MAPDSEPTLRAVVGRAFGRQECKGMFRPVGRHATLWEVLLCVYAPVLEEQGV